jgi:hypothetical protein
MKCTRFQPFKGRPGDPDQKEMSDEEIAHFVSVVLKIRDQRSQELKETVEDEEYWKNVRIDYHIPEDKLTTIEERLEWLGYKITSVEETEDEDTI